MDKRLERFEAMLAYVQEQRDGAACQMAQLKAQGKERGAAYRQLMGRKLQLEQMLEVYKLFDLVER